MLFDRREVEFLQIGRFFGICKGSKHSSLQRNYDTLAFRPPTCSPLSISPISTTTMENDGPPPYREESKDILRPLLQDVSHGRGDDQNVQFQLETVRLTNFIQYLLVGDYQVGIEVALSSVDSKHFKQLYTTIRDLQIAHEEGTPPTPDDRREIAAYLWALPS